jgi:hypothetical protein
MKGKINENGVLETDKGNGYYPQVCVRNPLLSCHIGCADFEEPSVRPTKSTFWYGGDTCRDSEKVVIKLCGDRVMVLDALLFVATGKKLFGRNVDKHIFDDDDEDMFDDDDEDIFDDDK